MQQKNEPLQLPNGCRATYPKVHPLDWERVTASLKKDWYIHYRFFDPAFKEKHKYGLLVIIKGMNNVKTHQERRRLTIGLLEREKRRLKEEGHNPITKLKFIPPQFAFELFPQTPFIKSLWLAVDKLQISHDYKIGVKSVIRGVEKAAIQLKIEETPVIDITRKYIKVIFEKCGQLNPKWSPRQHNYYRTALIILFKELIQQEAVDANPVKEIPKRAEVQKERLTLTPEERNLINDNLHKFQYHFWRVIQIFFHSGSRETELLNVRGRDVDLKNQTCKYIVKKGPTIREIRRPIKDIVLPLWEEQMLTCKSDDYLFSFGLLPGEKAIRRDQLTRRWRRHVKQKLDIKADFYSLKHSNTTEIVDLLSEQEAAKLNAHTSTAMVVNIYDVQNKKRKDDRLKKVRNKF